MTPLKGQVDELISYNTIPCVVDQSQSGTLVPGQPVKLVDNTSGVPSVIACTADTDVVFGYVNYSAKQNAYAAGDALQVSVQGNVMYMEASAAIARGAAVKVVIAGQKVATATTGATIGGWAFDKASANGDMIRVWIKGFGSVYTAA